MTKQIRGAQSPIRKSGGLRHVMLLLVVLLVASTMLVGAASAADAVANVTKADGTTTSYTTFDDAWDGAISAGTATITLLSDASMSPSYQFTFNDLDITLDLNGKSLSTLNENVFGLSRGKLTVKNGTIMTDVYLYGGRSCTLTVEDVTFSGVISPNGGTLTIKSGDFSQTTLSETSSAQVTKTAGLAVTAPAGYMWLGDTTLIMGTPVAAVDNGNYNAHYQSIQDAINVATAGQTVTLLTDTSETGVTVAADDNVIINLNGKTVNGNFIVHGKATIRNGTIVNTNEVSGIESNGASADLTVEKLDVTSNYHALCIDGGKATITSGTYTSTALAIPCYAVYVGSSGATTLTIDGGTFIPSPNAGTDGTALKLLDGQGTTRVNGGEFQSEGRYSFENSGTMTITGGTFENGFTTGSDQTLEISGGTFGVDPSVYVKAGYAAFPNDAKTIWEVLPGGVITFYTDGGSPIDPMVVKAGDQIIVQKPTKDDYVFTGWNPELPEAMPAKNLEFTAQWESAKLENIFTYTFDKPIIDVGNGKVTFPVNFTSTQADMAPTSWEIKVKVNDSKGNPVASGLTYTVNVADYYAYSPGVEQTGDTFQVQVLPGRIVPQKLQGLFTIGVSGLDEDTTGYTITADIRTYVGKEAETARYSDDIAGPADIPPVKWILEETSNIFADKSEGLTKPWNTTNNAHVIFKVANLNVDTYVSTLSDILAKRGDYPLSLTKSGTVTIKKVIDSDTEKEVQPGTKIYANTAGKIIMDIAAEDKATAKYFIIEFIGNKVGDVEYVADEKDRINILDVDYILHQAVAESGTCYLSNANYLAYADVCIDEGNEIDIDDATLAFKAAIKKQLTAEEEDSIHLKSA